MRFGEWLAEGHELGFPTIEDFSYHLTTLFPPVRPKGWLELRMFDALPSPAWEVAVAVTCILLSDHALADDISDAVTGTERLWVDAAQLGLGHPDLARSASRLFALAGEALAAAGVSTRPARPGRAHSTSGGCPGAARRPTTASTPGVTTAACSPRPSRWPPWPAGSS